jgi:hypothetical protein
MARKITPMLSGLMTQAESEGADLVTLRALIEEACENGATRALAAIGLQDVGAGADIIELRQLVQGWRDAKRAAFNTVVVWLTRTLVAALLIGLAVKMGMVGISRP